MNWQQDLKAKILQFVIIPCFATSFEKQEGEKLIGGPPAPDQDNPDNIISVFINKVNCLSKNILLIVVLATSVQYKLLTSII